MGNRIDTIVFDFGAVLVDWNPHYVYDPYFGNREEADVFLRDVCTLRWNGEVDKGKPIAEATAELVEKYPEREKEIRLYFDRWQDMIGGEIPGMVPLIRELKAEGYRLYGLSNWARETFNLVENRFEAFRLLDGYLISGDARELKPDPAIYRAFLDKFALRPDTCLFIDDNADNVAGAEACGIRSLRFTGPEALRGVLEERGIL